MEPRPVLLALPPQPPASQEGWLRYRRRMAERLEPVWREVSRRFGLELTPLHAANALHGPVPEDELSGLRHWALGTEDSLIDWGDLLPGAQMDDVVVEIGLTAPFEAA